MEKCWVGVGEGEEAEGVVGGAELDKFKRDLADARRWNMPKQEADDLFHVANSVVPPVVYENFMMRNMGNGERIANFKKAISKRVERKFDDGRKDRLAALVKDEI